MGGSSGSRRKASGPVEDAGSGVVTVRLTVEYDGTDFKGFQWQPGARTVAGTLEAVLSKIFDEPLKVTGAGRTDSGVHASGQVVSFSAKSTFPYERLTIALNSALPGDLRVRTCAVVDEAFSARFSARERSYVYAIFNRREPSALLGRWAYHVWRPVDVAFMQAAAKALLGTHDFASFCGVAPDNGITQRTVRALEIERRGDLIRLAISADGFLHRMVRTITGTLLECGWGRRPIEDIPRILATKDRRFAGHTAGAEGLYLAGVRYEGGYDSYAEPPVFAGRPGP